MGRERGRGARYVWMKYRDRDDRRIKKRVEGREGWVGRDARERMKESEILIGRDGTVVLMNWRGQTL